MAFRPSLLIPFFIKSWRERISKSEISSVQACLHLNMHEVDDIIKILNHLSRLASINGVSLGVMKLCLQDIELPPGLRLGQIAVMRDKVGAVQAKRAVVGANTQTRAAISQNGRSNQTPLFKKLAKRFIHLLECPRLWYGEIGDFSGRDKR